MKWWLAGIIFFLLTLSPRQKEVRFLVALVCLSVCLFVDVTQKVMNGLGLNSMEESWVVPRITS